MTASEGATIVATGDRGQTLRVTVASIKGSGAAKERAEVAASLRTSARRAIRQMAADFKVLSEGSCQLSNGLDVDHLDAHAPTARLLQCGISASSGVLLLSVEGAAADVELQHGYSHVLDSIAYRA